MKFQVTHPKIWNKLSEKTIPMKHKIQIYEKLGGAYRLGEDGGEQVFNKMTEQLSRELYIAVIPSSWLRDKFLNTPLLNKLYYPAKRMWSLWRAVRNR